MEYGANDMVFAATMAALFPNGIETVTFEDWYRLHILILIVVKLTRYATNFEKGGHRDSIHDLTVYGAMLEAFDANVKEKKDA